MTFELVTILLLLFISTSTSVIYVNSKKITMQLDEIIELLKRNAGK